MTMRRGGGILGIASLTGTGFGHGLLLTGGAAVGEAPVALSGGVGTITASRMPQISDIHVTGGVGTITAVMPTISDLEAA